MQVEQVDSDRVEHLAGGEQAVGRRLQMRTGGLFAVGAGGLLEVLPQLGRVEQILVVHRLEQGLELDVAEAETEERRQALGRQIQERERVAGAGGNLWIGRSRFGLQQ